MKTFNLMEVALDTVYNGVIIIDDIGKLTYCNNSACELIGVDKELILGKNIKEVIPNTELDQVLEEGTAQLSRKFCLGNREVITNRTPVRVDGKIVGAIAVFQDITEIKDAMNKIDSIEHLLNKLEIGMEHLSDGVVMVDERANITMITESYCELLGVTLEESVGKHVASVIENTRMHKVVKNGKPEIGDIQRINGRDIIVMRIPLTVKGKVVGAIGQIMFQEVSDLVKLAKKLNLVEKKLEYYKQEYQRWQRSRYNIRNIIGSSKEIEKLKTTITKVSQYPSTVLIRGESGTGKELIAHSIHDSGPRREGPFVRVNCAAIPKELLEAELFGYEEGSFTGAKKQGKPGKFEIAEGGTIFLDEIGDMPLEMQVKLLRVLQEKEIERVGGTKIKSVNTRVIASTNRKLEEMVQQGIFRQDLYYRLNVVNLRLPPLREIKEDIEELSNYIIRQLKQELGVKIQKISPQVEQLFSSYHWPGNVRELRNVIERAANVMDGNIIELNDLPLYLQDYNIETEQHTCTNARPATFNLSTDMKTTEAKAIKKALAITGYNKSKTAEILDIHRATLYRKMKRLGI